MLLMLELSFLLIYYSILYSIDEQTKTASVVSNNSPNADIFIPRSITHNSQEYLVTCIRSESFRNSIQLKSIRFPPDSELKTIEENAFFNSSIESLTIPSKLTELKDGWSQLTINLDRITVSQDNPCFTLFEEKFILGKSTSNQKIFFLVMLRK